MSLSIFNSAQPILRRKQQALDIQDRKGVLNIKLQINDQTLFSLSYTRIDQAFILWGLIAGFIFITGQLAPISWTTQAIFWSILTVIGTLAMVVLTQFWVKVERLQWVLYCWVALMILGVVLTDLGIFQGWVQILIHLPHIWLGLSAIGYLCTGLGLHSRALIFAGVVHLLTIACLNYVGSWQFLTTGLIMATNLLIFAENQWDMRPPIENYALLNEEQKRFNQQQFQVRQADFNR